MQNIREFLFENFQFLEVKISTYLNRRVFVMYSLHYENMHIQIYWKFYHQKMKIFR